MKILKPDDLMGCKGKLVTLLGGPFDLQPVPPAMWNGERMVRVEDRSMHGKVFELIAYDPPMIMLRPLEGIAPKLDMHMLGQSLGVAQMPHHVPQVLIVHTEGLQIAEVSSEWINAYLEYCCPKPKTETSKLIELAEMAKTWRDYKRLTVKKDDIGKGTEERTDPGTV